MSAIASFYLLDTSKLDELNTKQLKSFDGSGYIYINLIMFLQEERNIDLTQGEYATIAEELNDKKNSSHFILTNKLLNQLDPEKYTLAELQKFNAAFSDEGDEETARLTLDAIKVLHHNLGEVQNDNQVLLLIVG